MDLDRRRMLAAAGAAWAGAGAMSASTASYEMKPLKIESAPGLSEKLLASHHANNYGGAVRRLGLIQSELAALDPRSAPGFLLNGLKREEIIALNSVVLHEIYFEAFAGDSEPDRRLGKQIAADFGSLDSWRNEFAAMGKALAGGSGWVLLTWSPRAGRLLNLWAADHTMTAADGAILQALDMYEHAYAMDYGANAAGYVDAFLAAMRWSAASRRLDSVSG